MPPTMTIEQLRRQLAEIGFRLEAMPSQIPRRWRVISIANDGYPEGLMLTLEELTWFAINMTS